MFCQGLLEKKSEKKIKMIGVLTDYSVSFGQVMSLTAFFYNQNNPSKKLKFFFKIKLLKQTVK